MPNRFGIIEEVEWRPEHRCHLVRIGGIQYTAFVAPGTFGLELGAIAEFFPYRWRPLFDRAGPERWCAVIYSVRPKFEGERYIICTDTPDHRFSKTRNGHPYIIFDTVRDHFIERSKTNWLVIAMAIRAYAYRLPR